MNHIETLQTTDTSNIEQLTRLAQQCAHDIRSPLSALNLLISTLNHMSEEQRSLLNQVIDRINSIADELLDHSLQHHPAKSFHSAKTTTSEWVEAKSLIEETISLKQLEYPKFNLTMDIKIDGDLTIELNEDKMKRVLSNIINNSIEAGSSQVHIRAEKQLSSLVLSVEDNGVGIPASVLRKINSGEQITYGKADTGHGLGLSHASAAINSFGGSLVIDSKLGKGTTVTIYLLC